MNDLKVLSQINQLLIVKQHLKSENKDYLMGYIDNAIDTINELFGEIVLKDEMIDSLYTNKCMDGKKVSIIDIQRLKEEFIRNNYNLDNITLLESYVGETGVAHFSKCIQDMDRYWIDFDNTGMNIIDNKNYRLLFIIDDLKIIE